MGFVGGAPSTAAGGPPGGRRRRRRPRAGSAAAMVAVQPVRQVSSTSSSVPAGTSTPGRSARRAATARPRAAGDRPGSGSGPCCSRRSRTSIPERRAGPRGQRADQPGVPDARHHDDARGRAHPRRAPAREHRLESRRAASPGASASGTRPVTWSISGHAGSSAKATARPREAATSRRDPALPRGVRPHRRSPRSTSCAARARCRVPAATRARRSSPRRRAGSPRPAGSAPVHTEQRPQRSPSRGGVVERPTQEHLEAAAALRVGCA